MQRSAEWSCYGIRVGRRPDILPSVTTAGRLAEQQILQNEPKSELYTGRTGLIRIVGRLTVIMICPN